YQRLADWTSSVNRVSSLLIALDQSDRGEYPWNHRIVSFSPFASRLTPFISARPQAIGDTGYCLRFRHVGCLSPANEQVVEQRSPVLGQSHEGRSELPRYHPRHLVRHCSGEFSRLMPRTRTR